MVPKIPFIFVALSVCYVCAGQGKLLDEDLSKFVSNMKAELVRNIFKPRLAKKDTAKVTLSHEKEFEMNITSASELGGALFRRSKENYMLNGSQILKLHEQYGQDTSPERYSLNPVSELAVEEGFMFIKQFDWQNIFFLGICYPEDYCQVVMSHSVTMVTLQQRIATHGTPFDLEFFVDNEELYLIIATDPCTIYRIWPADRKTPEFWLGFILWRPFRQTEA